MPRLVLSLAAAMLAAGPVLAQAIGEPIPGREPVRAKRMPAAPAPVARPCPEYGPGFVKLDGSSLCVRASGSVAAEFSRSSRYGSGSAVGATVQLEARGETSLGPVRSVVRGRVVTDRGFGDRFYR
jgi:hypothetical protein